MQGKRILLGVTGGIAAYKSPDLVRRLREQGAEVQVVMTAAAREFVTATDHEPVEEAPFEALISALATDQALAILRPEERILIHLRYRHDLSQAEVARTMDLPEGTVKVRLHRIRKRLKDAWQEDC